MSNFDYSQLKVPADYGDHRGTVMGRALTAGEFDADIKAMIDHGDLEHVHQDDIGQTSIDVTSLASPITLTLAEAKKGIIVITGTLSSSKEIRFPAGVRKLVAVFNQTTPATPPPSDEKITFSAGTGGGLKVETPAKPNDLILLAVDSANNNIRSWGGLGMGRIYRKVFTANGTFTPPAGVSKFWCRIIGAGGGGAGGKSAAATTGTGGGGSGAAAGLYEGPLTISEAVPVTIGQGGPGGAYNTAGSAGGTTSIGALVSIPGAGGGALGTGSLYGGVGGAGGAVANPTLPNEWSKTIDPIPGGAGAQADGYLTGGYGGTVGVVQSPATGNREQYLATESTIRSTTIIPSALEPGATHGVGGRGACSASTTNAKDAPTPGSNGIGHGTAGGGGGSSANNGTTSAPGSAGGNGGPAYVEILWGDVPELI